MNFSASLPKPLLGVWAGRTALVAGFLAASASANAANLSLDFASLPSAQGWSYMMQGNSVPETSVFSVSGGVLNQSSLGVGIAPQGSNRYNLDGALDVGWDTTLSVRAQLIASENEAFNNYFGFSWGWLDGTGAEWGVALSGLGLETSWGFYSNVDVTQVHDYLLVGHAGRNGSAPWGELFVDGHFQSSGLSWNYGSCAAFGVVSCNQVFLGDATGGVNAAGKVYSFSLTQSAPVPEPGSAALLLSGSLWLWGRRQRSLQRIQQQLHQRP